MQSAWTKLAVFLSIMVSLRLGPGMRPQTRRYTSHPLPAPEVRSRMGGSPACRSRALDDSSAHQPLSHEGVLHALVLEAGALRHVAPLPEERLGRQLGVQEDLGDPAQRGHPLEGL